MENTKTNKIGANLDGAATLRCGHTEDGHDESHEKCIACYTAESEEFIDYVEKAHKLPALRGTKKQITWARRIRAHKISSMHAVESESRTLELWHVTTAAAWFIQRRFAKVKK